MDRYSWSVRRRVVVSVAGLLLTIAGYVLLLSDPVTED